MSDLPEGFLTPEAKKEDKPEGVLLGKAPRSNFDDWALTGRWENVGSSFCRSISYNAKEEELKVRFKDGGGKGYSPVDMEQALQFFNSGSKGQWIWSNILVRGHGGKGKTQGYKVRSL